MNGPRGTFVLLSTLAACLFSAAQASAGWISTQNETQTTLAVQEVGPGLFPKRGKVIRLLAGEVSREFCPVVGEKRLQVWDPRQPGKILFDGKVVCPPGDVTFRIVLENQAVKIIAVPAKPK